jgi:hypothetical protein
MKTSLIAGVLAALALAVAPTMASAQVPAACPATFTVLHNDSIGAFSVPAGHYQLTATGISCHAASDRFRQFLEDFDGRLPRPWRLDAASATFSGGGASFSIARVTTPSGGGGGRHPATGTHCPSTFQVLHDDHIGSFEVPAGPYTVTLLSVGPLSCAQATRLLAGFLQDFDGRLQSPWVLDQATGTFLRGSASVGFRIDPAARPSGGGGGTHPAGRRCPGTFRVQHNDRIDRLRLSAGPYRVTLAASRRPTCAAASRLLARFLQRGQTTRPWRVRASTATFSRPSGAGFRVKPVA